MSFTLWRVYAFKIIFILNALLENYITSTRFSLRITRNTTPSARTKTAPQTYASVLNIRSNRYNLLNISNSLPNTLTLKYANAANAGINFIIRVIILPEKRERIKAIMNRVIIPPYQFIGGGAVAVSPDSFYKAKFIQPHHLLYRLCICIRNRDSNSFNFSKIFTKRKRRSFILRPPF